MAPRSIFIILIFQYLVISFAFYFAFILLCIFITKIPKILSYHIYQISLSYDRVGIDNPLLCWLRGFICFVLVRGTRAQPPIGLIPWFSKIERNTYATLLHHPFLFKGKPTQCSRGSKKDFWHRCQGVCAKVNIPSTYHTPLSPALHYFPFASRFPLPHFTLAVLFALSFSFASFRLLLVCSCVGLLACHDGSTQIW